LEERLECYSLYEYYSRQGNEFSEEGSDSPRFLRHTRNDQSCRSVAVINCDGERNLYRGVSDAINQQQKSCLSLGKGSETWSGQEGFTGSCVQLFKRTFSNGLEGKEGVIAGGGNGQ